MNHSNRLTSKLVTKQVGTPFIQCITMSPLLPQKDVSHLSMLMGVKTQQNEANTVFPLITIIWTLKQAFEYYLMIHYMEI